MVSGFFALFFFFNFFFLEKKKNTTRGIYMTTISVRGKKGKEKKKGWRLGERIKLESEPRGMAHRVLGGPREMTGHFGMRVCVPGLPAQTPRVRESCPHPEIFQRQTRTLQQDETDLSRMAVLRYHTSLPEKSPEESPWDALAHN